MIWSKNKLFILIAATAYATALVPIVYADTGATIAEVFSVEGAATIRGADSKTSKPLEKQQKLYERDVIEVGQAGRVAIRFTTGYFVRLSGGSSLEIKGETLNLASGKLHFFNREADGNVQINTPLVSAAVRGTELEVTTTTQESVVTVVEGAATAKNSFGAADLASNEIATTQRGKAPVKSLLVSSDTFAQWTISMPRIVSAQEASSIKASHQDTTQLNNALTQISDGRIDSGRATISTLRNKISSPALDAQELLFALAERDSKRADSLAESLAGARTQSVAAVLARSYYFQRLGKLEASQDEIASALKIWPNNELLLARAAELDLYFGRVDAASDAIQTACGAVCTAPALLMLKGYVYLAHDQGELALDTFRTVLTQAPSMSEAYLGQGLAQARLKDLEAAKQSFETAIALDPRRSSYRSYLGKVGFERDNYRDAYREYAEAERLDPQDPTPHLYRAYARIADNDPLGAIDDIETAIQKNDNAAVYRSRMLLDQDTAVRSSALSRAFRETGFQDAARVEAIRSVQSDPMNYSAYRLLAESYDTFFFADTAISERRRSRLLAPVGLNLQTATDAALSLSAYDTLLDGNNTRTGFAYSYDGRDKSHIPSAITVGKQDSMAWQLSASSALIGTSLSADRYLKDTELNGIFEYGIDYGKKIMFEGAGRFIDNRDRDAAEDTIDTTIGKASLSYVQKEDADTAFIADVGTERVLDQVGASATDRTVGFTILGDDPFSDLDTLILDQNIYEQTNVSRAGLQYLKTGDRFSWQFGSQLIHQTPHRREDSLITDDSLGILGGSGSTIKTQSQTNLTGHDAYGYLTTKLADSAHLTTGIVRTDLQLDKAEVAPFIDETASNGRFSPKVGATWEPTKHTLFRTSYTESLRKSSLEDFVSLEPSFVAGLPQRFTDFSGTTSRDFGVGLDWKDPGNTYLGSEYVYRRLSSPLWLIDESITVDPVAGSGQYDTSAQDESLDHRRQHLLRNYINQRLTPTSALTFTYRRTQDDSADAGLADSIKDDTLSATLRWFGASGFFAYVEENWRRQSLVNRSDMEDGVDTAWISNAGIGYRLPHRRGRILLEGLNIFDQSFLFDQSTGFQEFIKPDAAIRLLFETNF